MHSGKDIDVTLKTRLTMVKKFGLKVWTIKDRSIHSYWILRRHLIHLKRKLFGYGIDGKILGWIDSFLCFRQQRIVVIEKSLIGLQVIESEIRRFADDYVAIMKLMT